MTLTLDRPTTTPDPPIVPPQADPDELVIVVKQDHIDRGCPQDSDRCAIALAAQETTGDSHASMGRYQLVVNGVTWHAGADATEFTYLFDTGVQVYPGRFSFKRSVWRSA